ncbi:MAG: hypothetical protein HOP95_10010 [Sphingomonas sp.]|nr:hypothetical protein [Sphingomonas sp.]
MSILAIIIAVVLALVAFRFVRGLIKIGCLALIAVFLIWFFVSGVAH